ncbi:hypothetical protein [Lyngbya sp. PCC 8106]|uniref:hypothetical protein n=1 Tax=Lyngbya sp. (strain PCC 8106) TaxID=313612 RepID=UPI0000EAB62F|nr:hypothetical protein [Lyngbya sp. PCC 8106]EAW36000.1 hypothetical protein L8106_22431 [Lyngbya sp. PCC 8106]
MVTKNIRAVTYLPPKYHQKLKDYANQKNLTESATLVEIVKQFFEGNSPQNNSPDRTIIEEIVKEQLAGTEAEIVTLKAQMEQMQQLLAGVMSGKTTARKTRSTPSFVKPKLQPLKAEDLANRLGVTPETVEKEAHRGNEHFLAWSKSKDIGRVSWEKRGELYYPIR